MNLIEQPPRTATAPRLRALWSRLPRPRKPRPGRARQLPAPAELGGPLRAFRAAALWGTATLIATATGSAFTESYRGLYEWAQHHGFSGFWAAAFPLQVDLFIAVGELVLFVAMLDAWRRRDQAGAWAVALLGLAVSIAGNVGHIAAHDLQSRGTAAVPPVAAFGALWLGLGVLKRILRRRKETAAETAQSAQQAAEEEQRAAERDELARALDELSGAVMLLAGQRAEAVTVDDTNTVLLGELLDAVRELAERPAGALPAPVPDDAESAALASYRATYLAGNPWSQRQMETRFGLTRGQFARMRDSVHAELDPGPVETYLDVPPEIRFAPAVNGSGAHG